MATIRFKARLQRPAVAAKGSSWVFLVLPASASTRLPTRNAVTVDGAINGHVFRAVLQPDGKKSHWLRVSAAMLKAAGAVADEVVTLEITPSSRMLEPKVPPDLRKALDAAPQAQALWIDVTPIARRDWIQWIISAKQAATRARRINTACDMLASGKRRVCCFDSSGFYSKGLGSPTAAAAERLGRFSRRR